MALEPRDKELVATGASVGANCHPLVERHVTGVLERGLPQDRSAIKIVEFVQAHAGGVTAEKAAAAIGAAELTTAAVP